MAKQNNGILLELNSYTKSFHSFFKIKVSRDAFTHVAYGSKILHRDNFPGIFNYMALFFKTEV